jgi:hypothetical protein
MLSFRKLMILVLAISCLLLLPQIAAADPIHSHCATMPWSLTRNPLVNVSTPVGGSFTISLGPIQFDQLPPMVANCRYETSDITSINITLNFTNGTGLIEATVIGINETSNQRFSPIGSPTFPFPNGQAGATIQFTLHTVGVAFHVMPGQLFRLDLTSRSAVPQGNVTATITASGNHYYQPVPEPATILLLGTGVAGIAIRTRKRLRSRKRRQGTQ